MSGHRGPSPSPIGGPGPPAIGRSQLSGGGSINSLRHHAVEQGALSYWIQSLTSHVAVPSCPSFQLHISCETAALWSDRRSSSGSKGGWEEVCCNSSTETCPSC